MTAFKQKPFFKILLMVLAVMFMAQGCNLFGTRSPKQETIELVWWKPFEDARFIQPLVDEFQKIHPNVRVVYTRKNIETYEDELVDALAEGRGPDIFSIHNDWLPKHQAKLEPAPAEVFGLRQYRETFLAVASADFVAEDQIYAVPLAVDVLALYYNQDILSSAGTARPPATWQEVVGLTAKLTRQDSLGNFQRSAVALGTADNINRVPDILALLMLQNGTSFYSPDGGQSTLDQTIPDVSGVSFSPGARALEFYTQFANPAKVTYTWNNRSNNSIEAFSGGQVAMILGYAYLRPILEAKAPFLNYGIAPVPQIDVKQNRINFANYWAESVSKQSKHAKAAWEFLKFITSKEVLPKFYEVQKQVSSRVDLVEGQIADPDIGVFAENALSARGFRKPDSAAVETIFLQMINDVILRNTLPVEAVKAATQKINLLLRNR